MNSNDTVSYILGGVAMFLSFIMWGVFNNPSSFATLFTGGLIAFILTYKLK